MSARIRLRRADHDNWATDNPVLDHGEIGLVFDEVGGTTTIVGWVVGNGSTVWASLPIMRPPKEGSTRTGLGTGTAAEGAGSSPCTWDDIALLALPNTFAGDNTFTPGEQVFGPATTPASETPLTVKGKLTVTESSSSAADGDLTVSAGDVVVTAGDVSVTTGDVTLVNGELTIPLHSAGDDTHHLRGASSTTGGIAFNTAGPFMGNSGGDAGKVMTGSEYGPFIQVTEDAVVVGGTKDGDGVVASQTAINYAAQPQGASTWAGLTSDLSVPSKLLVEKFGALFTNMVDGAATRTTFDGGSQSGTAEFTYNDSSGSHSGEHPAGSIVTIFGSKCGTASNNLELLTVNFDCTGSWIGWGQAHGFNQGSETWYNTSGSHFYIKMTTESTVECKVSTNAEQEIDGITICDIGQDSTYYDNFYRYTFIRIA